MAKNKKKRAKKKKSGDLLDTAAQTLKKFRRITKHAAKLNTAQKVVGGVALLAAGLAYIAQKQARDKASVEPDAQAAEAVLATLTAASVKEPA